jgi:protein involved in polysaccharide export with SLBB domain
MVATDPAYKLVNNDSIAVYVLGQNEFSTEQRIDNRGVIRMWQLDEVPLAGKTVREAEGFLEKLLVERKLLKKPMVQISVREYYPREIYLTGAFNGPGTYTLTRDEASIELKKLVVSRGGLQPKAAGNKVEVTRPDPNGGKTVTIPVDVEAMLKGKGPDSFLVYPGDTIYAPLKWF